MATSRAAIQRAAAAAEQSNDGLERLLRVVSNRFTDSEGALVSLAFAIANRAHAGQYRLSGDPYITHPLAVAQILAELGMDAPTLAAALLHDVMEDCGIDESTLRQDVGPVTSALVAGCTKISALEDQKSDTAEAEFLRRIFFAASDDLRVVVIKVADRLHNMRTLDALPPDRQRRIAAETQDIYAPLANRLGMWQLKTELEDLALRALDRPAYDAIHAAVARHRHENETYLANVIHMLDERLRSSGIEASLSGRIKHYYSIYRKMMRKEVGPEDIYDILAVRVLVDDVNLCYQTLGYLHAMWAPIPGEFDDYVARPKSNMYQSLHTTVLGPGNRPLEIQIRTHDMHEMAEHGVAAHWLYKEDDPRARGIADKVTALRHLLISPGEDDTDAQSFVAGLMVDIFSDQVYVFTPNGDLKELPTGSTPVDFAYHVHTEVGHRCRGAIVDGKLVALHTPLVTGQTVKIITAKGDAGPSRDWLNPALGYAKSLRAQSKIRLWFRRQARGAAIRAGRDVLDRQLRKLGLTRVRHEDVAKSFGIDRLDDFLAAVGRSEIAAETISGSILAAEDEASDTLAPPVVGPPAAPAVGPADATGDITVRGVEGVYTRIARCCRPVPGEAVIGYVTRGRGVTLHRQDCRGVNALRAREPHRFIQVSWRPPTGRCHPIELKIVAYDRAGLVRDITDVIAHRGANMSSVTAATNPSEGTAVVTAIVEVRSHTEVASLIDKLETIDNVIEVRRPTG